MPDERYKWLGAVELSHLHTSGARRSRVRAMGQFTVACRWRSAVPRLRPQTVNKRESLPRVLPQVLPQAPNRAAGAVPAVAGAAGLWQLQPSRCPTSGPAAAPRSSRWQNPCSPKIAQRFATTSSPPPSSAAPSALPYSTCMIAARRLRPSLPSSAMASAYSAYHGAANGSQFTVTALGRWSILNKQLPGGHRPLRASATPS